jgi:hypothetical protein
MTRVEVCIVNTLLELASVMCLVIPEIRYEFTAFGVG